MRLSVKPLVHTMTRDEILSKYLQEATDDTISRGVHGDLSEAPEQPNLPSL